MSITRITIKNFKSIQNVSLNIDNMTCLIGKNGSGKSNIIKAIDYFYKNLTENNMNMDNFDTKNIYIDEISIEITYDLKRISQIVKGRYKENLKKMLNEHSIKGEFITIRMVQNKKYGITWNIGYAERALVFNIQPIYVLNTRGIDIEKWSGLWNVMGDIGNSKNIHDVGDIGWSNETAKNDFEKHMGLIRGKLKESNIEIEKSFKKQIMSSLIQIEMGGDRFKLNDEQLDFFSEGTNFYSYVKIFVFLISLVSRQRLKDCLILLDEPEIGLHPSYIEELISSFIESSSSKTKVLLSTHSSNMVKALLKNDAQIYSISLKNEYSKVISMPKLVGGRAKIALTNEETNTFFSDFNLFVEGATELELFQNKLLEELFPMLRRVYIVNTKSNNQVFEAINPTVMNLNIPFLILLDADKLISINKEKTGYYRVGLKSVKSYETGLKARGENYKKELYSYSKKYKLDKYTSYNDYQLKQYLIKYKKEFKHEGNWLNASSEYIGFISNLRRYYAKYNIFFNRTTIEGGLINLKTVSYFYDFMLDFVKSDAVENLKKLYNDLKCDEEKVVFMNLLADGKSDYLEDDKKHKKNSVGIDDQYYEFIGSNRLAKASLWVSDFLDYYEKIKLSPFSSRKERRKIFELDFMEISDIMRSIESRISE
ncbi:retron Eco8 family effector endonuclease [Listeria booriae]|uniref:retron Eco8 family effector endonuclease n=1 Tax=Listeria booriae TaxID=1552123 RepID=UPI0016281385|nr:retron Eco8 family effector endonuclease [Listeria booriae]MBC2676318.1 AAA family ATPase [Listeria booriae]